MKRKTLKAKSLGCALKKRAASGTAVGLFIVLAVLWTGCPNTESDNSTGDTTLPTVVSIVPADETVGLAPDVGSIVIEFSESVGLAANGAEFAATVEPVALKTAGFGLESSTDGGTSWTDVWSEMVTAAAYSDKTLTLTVETLTYGSTYRLTVGRVYDLAKNQMAQAETSTFTVRDEKSIGKVTPAGGPLTYGTGGTITYTVETFNLDGETAVIEWDDAEPADITKSLSDAVLGNEDTITISITASAATPAGAYGFVIVVGEARSAQQTFTVARAQIPSLTISGLVAPVALKAGEANPLPPLTVKESVTVEDDELVTLDSLVWSKAEGSATANVEYDSTYTATLALSIADVNYTFTGFLAGSVSGVAGASPALSGAGDDEGVTITFTFEKTIPTPSITLGDQTGTLEKGTDASVTYSVTAVSIAAATYNSDAITLNWTADGTDQSGDTPNASVTSGDLTISSDSPGTGTLTLTTTNDTAAGNHGFTITVAGVTSDSSVLTVTNPGASALSAPTSAALSAAGVVSWTASDNAVSYRVKLYDANGNTAVGSEFAAVSGETSIVDRVKEHGAGTYYIKVIAVGNQVTYKNSEESTQSGNFTVAAYSASFVYTAGSDTAGTLTLTFNAEVSGLAEGNISIDSGGTLTGESFNATGAPYYTVGVTGVAGNTPIQVTVTAPDYYVILTPSKQAAMPEWVDYVSAAVSPAVAGGNFDETTSAIVITFSAEIDTLAASNITLTPGDTGAAKNDELAHTGGTAVYSLPVSSITKDGTVGLSFTDPEGYHIGGAAEASVAVKYFAVVSGTDLELTSRVTAPQKGAAPDTAFSAPTSYGGVITWYESNKTTEAPAKFLRNTVYAAKIVLTVEPGNTLATLGTGAFTHDGASEVTYAGGVVWITFFATADTAAVSVGVTFSLPTEGTDLDLETDATDMEGKTFSWTDETVEVTYAADAYSSVTWRLDGQTYEPDAGAGTITLDLQAIGIGPHSLTFSGVLTADSKAYSRTVHFTVQ